MKNLNQIRRLALVSSCLAVFVQVEAQTTQTYGAGSAVTSIDRQATFDSITHSGIPLSDYTENSLSIGANADSLIGYEVFGGANPSPYFYCLDGGSMGSGADSWVTIHTTDSARIYGVEFLYGNSWTNGSGGWGNNGAWVMWQTFNGASVESSGQAGPYGGLYVGGIIGFYDPSGFDTLQVKCNAPNQSDPNIQALAMDNLYVQLTPVPEPATLGVLAVGAALLLRRKRRSPDGSGRSSIRSPAVARREEEL
ncbi:MAG: PEP-CTERM sorting domain-containing protein [Fimbriimonadales bacterium]